MSITIKDVAKKAGVGIGTVSRVLNGGSSVSESTRERVEEVIRELDYIPNQRARRFVTGKSLTIGIIALFFTSPSAVERLRGIEKIVAASDYDMVIFNADNHERLDKYTRQLTKGDRVDGLIVISMGSHNPEIERLAKANIPTVILDATSDSMPTVNIDDVAGGGKATRHLIKLGHRKIGFISSLFNSSFGNQSSDDRLIGYQNALAEIGIDYRPDYVLALGPTRTDGYQMGNQLLRLPDAPTAIVATSDILALGAMQAARELGLVVPYDCSVIGYDDIELAEFLELTTIRQPLYESGVRAAEILMEMLNQPDKATKKEEVLLPTSVVIRGTTAVVPR